MANPQYNFGHHALIELLFILTYTVRNPTRRKLAFLVLTGSIFHALLFRRMVGITELPFRDMAVGMRLTTLLVYASNDLFLHDALKEYRYLGDKRDMATEPFFSRLWWSVQVWGNPRGVGWTHELKGLPPKPAKTTRLRFIAYLVADLLFWLVIYDLHKIILRRNPYFTREQHVEGWQKLWRLHSFGYGINMMAEVILCFRFIGIAALSLGFSKPEDWPAPFGSLRETHSLASFWGKCWHASLKRSVGIIIIPFTRAYLLQPFVGHAKFVNQRLGLGSKSVAGSMVGLLVIFFMTGAMHAVGDYKMLDNWRLSGGALIFFLLQAPGLLLEQAVVALGRRAGIRANWVTYTLGYIWVYVWCAISLPFWSDPHIRLGCWDASDEKYGPLMTAWHTIRGEST